MTERENQSPPSAPSYIATFIRRNNLTTATFADKVGCNIDQINAVLNGVRLISHEMAHAIGKAFPQLNPVGLLHAQAKYRLHQLDNPELYGAAQMPLQPGRNRHTPINKDEVCRLYREGVALREIVEETRRAHGTGISLGTIYAIIDEAGIPRRGTAKPVRSAG